ncbi:uncharacterized protein LOC112622602 [Theropithecus gelada]|uniref:uncharacterized protein LOC112622602 n=1 Tax=Theropithecus gelada TaxID=9565 RepID=UPI000DC1886B|nr:uncharacterized protein LOC112622602 [Theropithecus gelada]
MKLRGLTYTNEGEGGRVLEGKKLRLETHWVHDGKGREDSGHQAESDEAGYQRKAKGGQGRPRAPGEQRAAAPRLPQSAPHRRPRRPSAGPGPGPTASSRVRGRGGLAADEEEAASFPAPGKEGRREGSWVSGVGGARGDSKGVTSRLGRPLPPPVGRRSSLSSWKKTALPGSLVQSRVESPVPALVDLCGRKGGCRGSALGRDNCLSGPGPCILGDVGADLVISRFMTPKRAGGG